MRNLCRVTRLVFAPALLVAALSAQPAYAVCGDGEVDGTDQCDGGACCEDNCTFTAAATTCRPAVDAACDVAEACTGASGDCPTDVLVGCTGTDGLDCTVPTCNVGGACTETDQCVQICRGPGFWANHSSTEKERTDLGQAVIDAGGSIEVCGQVITDSDNTETLDSLLEALCVRTRGVKERQLYRQLVTARLNCAISEGGTCDEILDRFVDVSFSDCNALCAGTPVVDGPTLTECKQQLSCFNKGGRLVEGECALGTCETDTELSCGAAAGDCPLINDVEQPCIPFEGNCADEELCSTDFESDAQICPDRHPASSPKTCQIARKNQCTIDDCA